MSAGVATGEWPAFCEPVEAVAKHSRSSTRFITAATELHASAVRLRAELAARRTSSSPPSSDEGDTRNVIVAREGRGRVLIVEDDDETARAAFRALTRAGYHVERERLGSAACRRLGEPWEAIVVDLDLGPGCSGLAVADEAHRRRDEHGARIVLWSGEPQGLSGSQLENARRRTRADACVEKGGSPRKLLEAVRPETVA